MSPIGSLIPRVEATRAGHPEPVPGTSRAAQHEPSTSQHPGSTASIVPGGGAFASPSSSMATASRPLVTAWTNIRVEGEPHVTYQVKDPHGTSPQWARAVDPQTGGPSSGGIEVQRNDNGQWVPVKGALTGTIATPGIPLTRVKVKGDSTVYHIKDRSNTTTPQPLFVLKPNGDLKQTRGHGTYDGHRWVEPDGGLRGGLISYMDQRTFRIQQAYEWVIDARRNAAAAEARVTQLSQEVRQTRTASNDALQKFSVARTDYLRARAEYVDFRDSHAASPPLAKEVADELGRLDKAQIDALARAQSASDSLEQAEKAYAVAKANVKANAARAWDEQVAWQNEVNRAEIELHEAENAPE